VRYFFVNVIYFIVAISLSCGCSAFARDHRYAAVVVDASGKVLHAENAHAPRHPASMVKKMTLYILFEALRAGKITLKTRFSVSSLAARQIPCKLGLQVGHTISVGDIIKGMVIKSANDASVVFAEGLAGSLANFVALMNKKAKKLGMTGTRFYNASGVPDARQITTAMDMAILARALYHDFPEYYHYFKIKNFDYKGTSHRNHNHMLGPVRDFHVDGCKTGFVNASGFNISTSAVKYGAKKEPLRLFAVVMGGQSWRSRDERAAKLLEEGFYKAGASSRDSNPMLDLKLPDKSEFQAVSYEPSQQQALDKSVAEVPVVPSPQYGPGDAELLETSLKTPVPKSRGELKLPGIIAREPAPKGRAASKAEVKKTVKNEAKVIPISATVVDGNQRALPPGWVVPEAPAAPVKKRMATVHLKKSAN
jgi:D-alanyl-D-alanine carboxypeptidase